MKTGKREKRKLLKATADKYIAKINEVSKKAHQDEYRLDITCTEKRGFPIYIAKINKTTITKTETKPAPPKKRGRPRKLNPTNQDRQKLATAKAQDK